MNILVIGAGGMLGRAVVKKLNNQKISKRIVCIPKTREELDIMSEKSIEDSFIRSGEFRPDVVINCSGYNDVDGAERNGESNVQINYNGVYNLAKITGELGILFIHVSTDYVFDGIKKKEHDEYEKPNPINSYGMAKFKAEEIVQFFNKKYYIVRTSRLFGQKGTSENSKESFVDKIIEKGKSEEVLNIVDDEYGCPTYSNDLANFIFQLILKKPEYGIYHGVNLGSCSWYVFAREIFKILKKEVKLKKIKSESLYRFAKRPKYPILVNTKFIKMRSWKSALREYLTKYE